MARVFLVLALVGAAFAEQAPPSAPIDALQALNDARNKLVEWKSYSGTLPLTAEVPGQPAQPATVEVAFASPNQLRVEMKHEEAAVKESVLLVFGPETIWGEARTEPAGGAAQVQVKKVVVDKIDSFSLGVLKRLRSVEGVPYLLFAKPGLLLEFVAQCFSLTATATDKEIAIVGKRTKDPEGLEEAADVLAGIRAVTITVAKDDKRLLAVELDGSNGGKVAVSYRDLGWGKAPEASVFDYKAPEGAKVEEADERLNKPGPTPDGAGGPEPPK